LSHKNNKENIHFDFLVGFTDSGTMSEHGASCYAPSTSPSSGSPHSVATGHKFPLPTPPATPEASQQGSPEGSPPLGHEDSPNSVTTGPYFAKKPLQPCTICALNPAKICLQVGSLPQSIQRSGLVSSMPFLVSISIVGVANKICGWLQDCGHADFCFPCVQGLTTCPTCGATIKGWHLVQSNSPPVNPLVLSLKAAFNSSIICNTSNQVTRKTKKRGLQCVEGLGDDPTLGSSTINDSDDDDDDGVDAGLLTWVASLEKVSETQLSNLESEAQPDTTLDNTLEGFESQGTQVANMREVKKKKKSHTACSLSKSSNQAARASCSNKRQQDDEAALEISATFSCFCRVLFNQEFSALSMLQSDGIESCIF
jgi:hypothetical protein